MDNFNYPGTKRDSKQRSSDNYHSAHRGNGRGGRRKNTGASGKISSFNRRTWAIKLIISKRDGSGELKHKHPRPRGGNCHQNTVRARDNSDDSPAKRKWNQGVSFFNFIIKKARQCRRQKQKGENNYYFFAQFKYHNFKKKGGNCRNCSNRWHFPHKTNKRGSNPNFSDSSANQVQL